MAFKIFRKNCCGLDVHKTWIYACIGITDTNGRTEYKQARFSSFTKGLQELADWLEIGADMSVFPSAKHLVSWAGCCPRNDQSSKKVKSTRISRAGVYLKPLLVQVANAVVKSDKYPECKERYRRIKARRGHKKAIVAVCRMLLTAIWNILSRLEPYSAAGYLEDKLTVHSVVITKSQGLELLRKRGYIFKDEVDPAPA